MKAVLETQSFPSYQEASELMKSLEADDLEYTHIEDADGKHIVLWADSSHNLKQLYLVSGRVCGDDDDTQHIVKADTLGDAESEFENQLRHDGDVDEKTEVFIISSDPLSTAIEQHI